MAVELKNRLQTGLGVSLPTTLAFDYPNIKVLTHYLSQEVLNLEVEIEPASAPQSPPVAPDLNEIKQLSQDELMAQIAQRFGAN